MHPASPDIRKRASMLHRPIPFVPLEAIVWMLERERPHYAVPQNLRDHARRRDRRAPRVRPGKALDMLPEPQIPIREKTAGPVFEKRESPTERLPVRQSDPMLVNPPSWKRDNGNGLGAGEDLREHPFTSIRRKRLRVPNPFEDAIPEDGGGGEDRPRQSAAPRLIRPRERPATLHHPRRVESVEGIGDIDPAAKRK